MCHDEPQTANHVQQHIRARYWASGQMWRFHGGTLAGHRVGSRVCESPLTDGQTSKENDEGKQDANDRPDEGVLVAQGNIEELLDADRGVRAQDDDLRVQHERSVSRWVDESVSK